MFTRILLLLGLLSTSLIGYSQDCDSPDFEALRTFFDEMRGEFWDNNEDWVNGLADPNCDPCSWRYVGCNGAGRVNELNFNGIQINTDLTPNISLFTELEVLSLNDCSIISTPDVLSNMPQLRELDLSSNNFLDFGFPPELPPNLEVLKIANNQFFTALPNTIYELSNLKVLDISSCFLTGTISNRLFDLTNMEDLDISDNELENNDITQITNFPNLRRINLSGNTFGGAILSSINELPNLTYVNLSDNIFEEDITNFLSTIPLVDTLILSDNRFSGSLSENIDGLESIVLLDLSINQLTGSIPSAFYSLSTLRDVNLGGNQISGTLSEDISNLVELESFNIIDNEVSGTIPSGFGDLKALKVLSLTSNNLSGELPEELRGMESIEVFSVLNNMLSGEVPDIFEDLQTLVTLNLTRNAFTGELPPSIGSLTAVRNLGLSDNQFTGTIPPSYENLNVTNFGAANNNLSGPVPEFLTKFTGIFLNDNDFEGCIPEVFLESCGGLVLDNNPKLSFGGDTEPFCNGESQGGASCDDGNPLTINDALNDACECVGIVPSCENEDAIALTILYNQLGGEDWTNQEGWAPELTNDNCDPCGWFGVNCNDEGEVIGLELVSNNLVGELTNDISRLTSLRDLNLGSNGITGSLPDSLSLINSLRTVSLDSNSITGGIPADYENLNIDIFSAVNNDLSGCYPAGLTTWCESQVDFSGNNQLPWLGNFSTFCDGEEQVGAACRVQTDQDTIGEDCTCTPFVDPTCDAFGFAALVSFYNEMGGANWTQNTGWIDGAAGENCEPCTWFGVNCENDQVVGLELANNNLVGTLIDSSGLFDLSSLTELDLSDNQISGTFSPSFNRLFNIEILRLNNNDLTGEISFNLNQLTSLVQLELADNDFSGNLPEGLGENNGLEAVNLSNNNFEGCFPATYSTLCDANVSFSDNPLLPWQGDFSEFCANNAQEGAPCLLPSGVTGVIDADCGCIDENCNTVVTEETLDLFLCPGEEFTLNGESYSAGSFEIVLRDQEGCDSVNLSLTIDTSFLVVDDIIMYENQTSFDAFANDEVGTDSFSINIIRPFSNGMASYDDMDKVFIYDNIDSFTTDTLAYEICLTNCTSTCKIARLILTTEEVEIPTPPVDPTDTVLNAPSNILFTPNGDSRNDLLVFDNLPEGTPTQLIVRDFYGKIYFRSEEYSNDWDGTYDGGTLRTGNYLYQITVTLGGKEQIIKGLITVING